MLDEIVDEICQEIAEEACETAVDYMYGSCVNAGQESLVGEMEDQVWDQAEAISNGEAEGLDPPVPEAVGEMAEVASGILEHAASQCAVIRLIAAIVLGGDTEDEGEESEPED